MQTVTHRNMFASRQDRTPTAVHTHPLRYELLAVQQFLRGPCTIYSPSQPCCCCFPARSTPVRRAVTTDILRGPDTPSPHLGNGKERSSSVPRFHLWQESFHPGCWQHFWGEITVGMTFLLSGCTRTEFWLCIPGPPKAMDSLPCPPMKTNARSFWNVQLLSLIHRALSLDQFVTHSTKK